MKRRRTSEARIIDPVQPPSSPSSAWPREASDDAETPTAAFADVAPLLDALAARVPSPRAALRVLDPYYCRGASARRLAALGFLSARNPCEDFYKSSSYLGEGGPDCDVIVTNPPFSGSHIPRLLAWVAASAPPALLLLPQHVVAKRAWHAFLAALAARGLPPPFYVGPRRAAYEFENGGPHATRRPGSFQCVWFCVAKAHSRALLDAWRAAAPPPEAALAEDHPQSLPQLMLAPRLTPAERRWRRKLRAAGRDERAHDGAEPPTRIISTR